MSIEIIRDDDGGLAFDGDPDDMPDYAAAAVVEGNGFEWDSPIWLPDESAAAMIEAGMLDADPVETVEFGDTTIHCYAKAGG